MKIKEIFDYLEDEKSYEILDLTGTKWVELNENSVKKLLDYITNLQEENKELNDDNIWWNNRFKAVQRNYKDYKSRNKKAIEYIDKELSFNVIINDKENKVIAYNKAFENIRNILESSDEQ